MNNTPKIKLYVASSLDGFIARENGELDWLMKHPNPNQLDYGYAEFLSTIDTVLMGRNTYEEILAFGVEWPYSDCKSFVISNQPNYQTSTPNTSSATIDAQAIQRIKAQSQKDIWIVGGGQVISSLLNLGEIDEIILTITPIILGKGIPLFPNHPIETKLDLIKSEAFDTGMINLTYQRKKSS